MSTHLQQIQFGLASTRRSRGLPDVLLLEEKCFFRATSKPRRLDFGGNVPIEVREFKNTVCGLDAE